MLAACSLAFAFAANGCGTQIIALRRLAGSAADGTSAAALVTLPTPAFAIDFTRESIQPLVGNQVLTFTRPDTVPASTHYGPDGLLRAAPHNFLVRSEEFQTSWSFNTASVVADASLAPNGTMTADHLVEDGSNGYHETYQEITKPGESLAYTATVYAKSGTRSHLAFTVSDETEANYAQARFDLASGAVIGTSTTGAGFTVIGAGVEAVGNGWYRLSLSSYTNSTLGLKVWYSLMSDSTSITYAGNGTGYLALWGAQLELNRTRSIYLPTAASPRFDGPRFDHHPITRVARGIRFEDERQNLFAYSDHMEHGDWTLFDTTLVVNSAGTTDPMGWNRAERAVETAVTADHIVHGWFGKPAAAAYYSLSVYAKKDQRDRLALMMHGPSSADRYGAEFNLTNGTASQAEAALGTYANGSYRIEEIGNGWYRCSITAEIGPDTDVYTHFSLLDATSTAGASIYAGNPSNGLYLYGAQAELASGAPGFASSYIPTLGSFEIRHHEMIQSGALGAWYTPANGTWFLDFSMQDEEIAPTASVALSLYTAANSHYRVLSQPGNSIALDTDSGSGSEIFAHWRDSVGGGIAATNPYLLAFTIDPGDTVARMNGAASEATAGLWKTNTQTTLNVPTSLRIGNHSTAYAEPFNGWIKNLRFYGERLTEAQLDAVTTIDPITFADDFDDGVMDSDWLAGVASGQCETCDVGPGATVVESSGQLQTTGHHLTNTGIDGYVTSQSYDMRGSMVEVELLQPISSVGNAANTVQSSLSIFPNGTSMAINFATYDHENDSVSFYGETETGGVWGDFGLGVYSGMGPAYDWTNHRFLRIRHDESTDYLYMETSPDRHTWTTLYYGQWTATSLSDVRFGIVAGKFGTGTATRIRGSAFDNFRTTASPNP